MFTSPSPSGHVEGTTKHQVQQEAKFCFAGGRKKGVGRWSDKWFSGDLQMFLIISCTSVESVAKWVNNGIFQKLLQPRESGIM